MGGMEEPLVRVLPSADVGGELCRATVGGTDVLLVRVADGRAVAFAATCPHQRTDLGDGGMVEGRIRCPLHHYEYDTTTGENVVPARHTDPADLWKVAPGRLPVFAVEERDGWVWVSSQPLPGPESASPAVESGLAVPPRPAIPPLAAEVVQAEVGTTFELVLPTAPRAGYVWRVDTGGSSLALVGQRTQPGHQPGHLVRLAARHAGRWTVRCVYARPWDRAPADIRTYEVIVSAG